MASVAYGLVLASLHLVSLEFAGLVVSVWSLPLMSRCCFKFPYGLELASSHLVISDVSWFECMELASYVPVLLQVS